MRQLAIRLAALGIPVLIVLVIAEATLRLFPSLIGEASLIRFPPPLREAVAKRLELPTNDNTIAIPTAERADHGPPLVHMAPNSIFSRPQDRADEQAGALARMHMDANGFCNAPEKAMRDHADIVAIGDSFTFCNAVRAEDTAAAQLEDLNGHSTYDLGVGGTGPYDYIEFLRNYGLKLKPRVVIMNLYEGNDLRDAMRYRRFVERGGEREQRVSTGDVILSQSYALSFLAAGYKNLAASVGRTTRVNFQYHVTIEGKPVPMNVADSDPDEVTSARSLLRHEIGMDDLLPPLQSLAELAKENNFQPLLTYIPSLYTAYAGSVMFEDADVGRDVQAFSTMQREWVKDAAAKLGLPFLDFTPILQDAAKTAPMLYFPANVHLTPLGHGVLARALSAKLAEMGIAPAKTTN